jgi:hypothetical protein
LASFRIYLFPNRPLSNWTSFRLDLFQIWPQTWLVICLFYICKLWLNTKCNLTTAYFYESSKIWPRFLENQSGWSWCICLLLWIWIAYLNKIKNYLEWTVYFLKILIPDSTADPDDYFPEWENPKKSKNQLPITYRCSCFLLRLCS